MNLDSLVAPRRLGPALAEATGDRQWLDLTARLVSGGKSNLTFELSSAAGSPILRRAPAGQLLPSAHDMAREARVQRALRESAVPVPEIVLADSGGEIVGVPCYVMKKVDGHIIRGALPAGYAAADADRAAIADVLIDTLASLHSIDPGAVGLGGFGRATG